MKALLISALPLILAAASAKADVFTDYKTLALDLAERTGAGAEVESLAADHEKLLDLGIQIMDLYGEANPNCAAQFDQLKTELPSLDTLSFDEIFRRYHSAQGLPTGPRHCYFGRGLVAHLLMTTARFRDGLTATERQGVVGDYEEVAEHTKQAKDNIDNPPN